KRLAKRTTRSAWKFTTERRAEMYPAIMSRFLHPTRIVLLAGTLGATAMAAGPALADDSVNTGYFGGVAIMGYDPVAYFTESHAVKGSEKFAYDWLGTPWHFAN